LRFLENENTSNKKSLLSELDESLENRDDLEFKCVYLSTFS
jgi:uncharacterized protein YpiB (UPF0302 family)